MLDIIICIVLIIYNPQKDISSMHYVVCKIHNSLCKNNKNFINFDKINEINV